MARKRVIDIRQPELTDRPEKGDMARRAEV